MKIRDAKNFQEFLVAHPQTTQCFFDNAITVCKEKIADHLIESKIESDDDLHFTDCASYITYLVDTIILLQLARADVAKLAEHN